jgi:hypothetical protein
MTYSPDWTVEEPPTDRQLYICLGDLALSPPRIQTTTVGSYPVPDSRLLASRLRFPVGTGVEADPLARAARAAGGLMIVRSERPSSIVRPEPEFCEKEIGDVDRQPQRGAGVGAGLTRQRIWRSACCRRRPGCSGGSGHQRAGSGGWWSAWRPSFAGVCGGVLAVYDAHYGFA